MSIPVIEILQSRPVIEIAETNVVVEIGTFGSAFSLQGVSLEAASVGAPSDKDILTYNDTTKKWEAKDSIVLGAPTGGDKGAGTLNATAVYDDDVLLTDWVFDLLRDGESDHEIPEGGRLYTLEEVEEVIRGERRLPWMPTRQTFSDERSLGKMISRLWFGQEQQQIYINEMEKQIAYLTDEVERLAI